MGNVVVIGSLNCDCIAFVDEFPRPGHTLMATNLLSRHGGKGANQAVAAAAQGAGVNMLGCVGDDGAGEAYRQHLERCHVRTENLIIRSGVPTGTALICVNRQAENTIVVGLGANGTLTAADVQARQQVIAGSDILLAQLEVPLEAVVEALRLASSLGVASCLNPSPWREDFPWGEVALDFVIVNEHEAGQLLGHQIASVHEAALVEEKLRAKNIRTLIITRGDRSTFAFIQGRCPLEIPVLPVEPVDTVGAGDSFAGAFAAHWSEHRELEPALRAASVAGSLATLKAGAQEAIPSCEEVEQGLARLA